MRQKTIVGLIMAAGAALMIAVGGWVMALIVLVLIASACRKSFTRSHRRDTALSRGRRGSA